MAEVPPTRPTGDRDSVATAVGCALAGCGSAVPDDAQARLVALVEAIATTPVGVTTVREPLAVVERHVADALRGLPAVDAAPAGPLVDVGSGGGIPGLVLAAVRPERELHLVESNGRKATFLREAARAMDVPAAIHALRSEDAGSVGGVLRDACAVVVARALAPPPVAAELCLPLAAAGGRVVLWVGDTADPGAIAWAAVHVGGALGSFVGGICVLEKTGPTPAGFPRRPGMAAKRPLA